MSNEQKPKDEMPKMVVEVAATDIGDVTYVYPYGKSVCFGRFEISQTSDGVRVYCVHGQFPKFKGAWKRYTEATKRVREIAKELEAEKNT